MSCSYYIFHSKC